jgi:hypothetical protein
MPPPFTTTWSAWRVFIPALWRQRREPEWWLRPELPEDRASAEQPAAAEPVPAT